MAAALGSMRLLLAWSTCGAAAAGRLAGFGRRVWGTRRSRRTFATVTVGDHEESRMSLGTILIIILILLLIGALPTWGHSRSWGYFPSGGLGLVLVIVIILVLLGRV